MVRVEMPLASWDSLLFMLSVLDSHRVDPAMADAMFKDISTQVLSQES